MGRFSSRPVREYPQQNQSMTPEDWPTVFDKPVVGIERDGVIIQDTRKYIKSPDDVSFVPGSLEAIRMIRLKGHKLVILTNQMGISKGLMTQYEVDEVNQYIMNQFGNAGIYSIDALFYSTSNNKEDEYAMPNIGMFRRAERESPNGVKFKEGWFVGDKMSNLKAADNMGAKPILVKTGQGEETLTKLNTFANKSLEKSTKVFSDLLEFANSL